MNRYLVVVATAALAAGPASAEAPAAMASAAPPCELHFWGSEEALTSNYSGVGGAVGGALAGSRPRNKAGLSGDLPMDIQAEALRRLDLARLLDMPGVQVIEGKRPLAAKAGKPGPRLTDSTAPCYAELVVDMIGYRSHITAGRDFGARYILRRFPAGARIARIVKGGKDVGLKIYPAKKPENHAAGLEELAAAFGKTTERFLAEKGR
jgi:hypothetical protein